MLWLAASVGFNVYLEFALASSPVFGALGGGLIVMTWLYLLCFGLLVGAELNAVLHGPPRRTAASRAGAPAVERRRAGPARRRPLRRRADPRPGVAQRP